MSNKSMYAVMFLISVAGVCVCIFLPWTVDWLKRTELGGLFVTLLILLGFIAYAGYKESVKIDEKLDLEHEARKELVAKFLRERMEKKTKDRINFEDV